MRAPFAGAGANNRQLTAWGAPRPISEVRGVPRSRTDFQGQSGFTRRRHDQGRSEIAEHDSRLGEKTFGSVGDVLSTMPAPIRIADRGVTAPEKMGGRSSPSTVVGVFTGIRAPGPVPGMKKRGWGRTSSIRPSRRIRWWLRRSSRAPICNRPSTASPA